MQRIGSKYDLLRIFDNTIRLMTPEEKAAVRKRLDEKLPTKYPKKKTFTAAEILAGIDKN